MKRCIVIKTKAQKVFVLIGGCIGDKYPIAVFSSMKKAEAKRQDIIKTHSYYKQCPEDLEIEPFILE